MRRRRKANKIFKERSKKDQKENTNEKRGKRRKYKEKQ